MADANNTLSNDAAVVKFAALNTTMDRAVECLSLLHDHAHKERVDDEAATVRAASVDAVLMTVIMTLQGARRDIDALWEHVENLAIAARPQQSCKCS